MAIRVPSFTRRYFMAAPALGWNRPLENSGDQAAGLPPEVAQVLEPAMLINYYPSGSLLFMEGQPARGIFLLLQGRVKLMVSAPTGKTLILKMAEEGDALGMASVVCSQPYEATAQIQGSAELGFVRAS